MLVSLMSSRTMSEESLGSKLGLMILDLLKKIPPGVSLPFIRVKFWIVMLKKNLVLLSCFLEVTTMEILAVREVWGMWMSSELEATIAKTMLYLAWCFKSTESNEALYLALQLFVIELILDSKWFLDDIKFN